MRDFVTWAASVAAVIGLLCIAAIVQHHPLPSKLALSTVLVSDDGGHGSGVHIGHGYILTAGHVVRDRDTMTITDSNGGVQVGTVLWANHKYDVALIQVDDPSHIAASKLACRPHYSVGQRIRAVGSPVNLRFLTTWGRISGLVSSNEVWKQYYIGDISIGPGMSGGPVFDNDGEVIGLAVGISLAQINMMGAPYGATYIVPSSSACLLMGEA